MRGRDGAAASQSAVVRWLTTHWLRRRWTAMTPLVLLVAAGTTGTMVAIAGAERTSDAYPRYVGASDVGDVVLNSALNTRDIDAVIRSLPNVAQVTSHTTFSVSLDDGRPRTRGEVEDGNVSNTTVLGSVDGRYITMDRPVVRSGRLPTGTAEAVLTEAAAAAEGLQVGDVTPVAFWGTSAAETLTDEAREAFVAEEVSPLGVEQVQVVGIVTMADEALPDGLFPRERMVVSADLAQRYGCLTGLPVAGSTSDEAALVLRPLDCAVAYRYYSLALDGGAGAVAPTLDAFLREAAGLNDELAQLTGSSELEEEAPSYFLVATATDPERQRVEDAIRPTVTALIVLGAAAAAVTLTLGGLAVARELQRSRREQEQWHEMGIDGRARALAIGTPPVLGVLVGTITSIPIAWLLTTGPLGLVRVLEPDPARQLTRGAALAGVGTGLVLAALAAALALRSARSPSNVSAPRRPRTLTSLAGPPDVVYGLRSALSQRAAGTLVGGGAVVVGVLLAALVFGASQATLVSTPRWYGWPWDVATMTGGGYGDLDLARAEEALADDPDIESWTVLGFLSEVALNGEPMLTMFGFDRTADLDLPLVDGVLPREDGEVAIGLGTARAHGLEVGDTVEIGGTFAPRPATVTGIVVFPALGPFNSDRLGAGTGLLLPEEMSTAAASDLFGSPEEGEAAVQRLATFVGVDLRDDRDTVATRTRLQEELVTLGAFGEGLDLSTPIRPAAVIDARSTRSIPTAVAMVFTAVAAVGLAFASWVSARTRRRELDVLRALGFSGRQVRRSVRVQSFATALGALVIGVPLGVVLGRTLWTAFARQLGVVSSPTIPVLLVPLTLVGAIALALLAAQLPAHLAGRSRPAAGLRME